MVFSYYICIQKIWFFFFQDAKCGENIPVICRWKLEAIKQHINYLVKAFLYIFIFYNPHKHNTRHLGRKLIHKIRKQQFFLDFLDFFYVAAWMEHPQMLVWANEPNASNNADVLQGCQCQIRHGRRVARRRWELTREIVQNLSIKAVCHSIDGDNVASYIDQLCLEYESCSLPGNWWGFQKDTQWRWHTGLVLQQVSGLCKHASKSHNDVHFLQCNFLMVLTTVENIATCKNMHSSSPPFAWRKCISVALWCARLNQPLCRCSGVGSFSWVREEKKKSGSEAQHLTLIQQLNGLAGLWLWLLKDKQKSNILNGSRREDFPQFYTFCNFIHRGQRHYSLFCVLIWMAAEPAITFAGVHYCKQRH